MWMRVGRGVGDFSRLRRLEAERERERLTLSFDLDLPDEPRRLAASTELIRPRSRDFGLSLPSFSFESTFLAGLRLFERD